MAAPAFLVVQTRMGEGQLGAVRNGAQTHFNALLAGILAVGPPPAHRQPLGPDDLEILPTAFMLAAVEHAEADPKAAADTRVGLGQQHRAVVWPPPASDALGRGQRG